MHEVARFMHIYPAYTMAAVLNEYAVTFFALLNEGYRVRYSDALLMAQVVAAPDMKADDRKNFYRQLEWASMHPSDILKSAGSGSDPSEIKKLL